MEIDLLALSQEIEAETHRYLDEYAPAEGGLGTPWSREKVAAELAEMRRCLVSPYWIDVELPDPSFDQPQETYPCVAVAEDPDIYLMVYMPHRDEFLLLWRDMDRWRSLGVDGDAVGTFLAR